MRQSIACFVLCGCATAVTSSEEGPADTGVLIVKDAGKPDTGPADTGPADSGFIEDDTGVVVDSGTCATCDLANDNACNGTVCGWDPMMGTSKCGYTLGQGTQGAACGANTPCAAGYVCVSPANKCNHWCKLPNGSCPNGSTCKGMLQNPPSVCGATYAVCQ